MDPTKANHQRAHTQKSVGKSQLSHKTALPSGDQPVRGVTAEDDTSLARFERAALILFVRSSVDKVTTKQIAAQAGLSEGLLYRYAPSKQSLAENMFFAQHNRLGTLVRNAANGQLTLAQQVDAITKGYCLCADDDWDLFSYHLLNTHRFLTNDKSIDNPVSATEDILKEAMKRGEIESGNATLLGAMALGVVLQPALHKAYHRLEGSLSQFQPIFTRKICTLLEINEKATAP